MERFGKEGGLALYLGCLAWTTVPATITAHVNTRAKAAIMTALDRHRKYAGKGEVKVGVNDIGRGLHRHPSIITRLYSAYAAARDQKKEAGTDPHALLRMKLGRRHTGGRLL